jgi:hypothetical protein
MIWMMIRMKAALTWMSRFSRMEVMIWIESLSLSLKFRNKIKFLGFAYSLCGQFLSIIR